MLKPSLLFSNYAGSLFLMDLFIQIYLFVLIKYQVVLEFISHKGGESLVFIRINACIADSTGLKMSCSISIYNIIKCTRLFCQFHHQKG